MNTNRIALAAATAFLAITGTAQATMLQSRHSPQGARLILSQPRHRHRVTKAALLAIGVGNVPDSACGTLPLGSFERIIVGWEDSPARAYACATAAREAGRPVLLVIQWDNRLDPDQIRSRFAATLAMFAGMRLFAVAVGNEQEGPWNGGVGEQAGAYAAIWRLTEPMIAQAFPRAIRVAGEVSPWGVSFMRVAAKVGLPGAQAFAFHAYPTSYGSAGDARKRNVDFAAMARQHHVQAWADEGLCGPDSWTGLGCVTQSELTSEGYALAAEWYAPTAAQAPPSISYVPFRS